MIHFEIDERNVSESLDAVPEARLPADGVVDVLRSTRDDAVMLLAEQGMHREAGALAQVLNQAIGMVRAYDRLGR